jgi:hypothetical protein
VVTETEFSSAMAFITAPAGTSISGKVRAPVLIVDGQDDALFCTGPVNCADPARVTRFEQPYFTGAASLTVKIVPDTGHDIALHPTANTSFAMISTWLRTTPGQQPASKRTTGNAAHRCHAQPARRCTSRQHRRTARRHGSHFPAGWAARRPDSPTAP